MTEPNKNSHFCVNSRNLIFPVFRTYTTQQNKLVGTDLKLCFFLKSSPPPELFQFPMTQKGNLQDSREIGNPLPPLLLETAGRTESWGRLTWESKPQRTWVGMAEGRVWEGSSRNKMLSNGFFLSSFISSFLISAFAVHSQLMYPFGVVLALLS